MKKNTINLTQPFTIDITHFFDKQLAQFDNDPKKLRKFYKDNFKVDKVPYYGSHRNKFDSTTEVSDITYDKIKVGDQLYWRRYKGLSYYWDVIEVTHKYGYVIFFKSLTDGRTSYTDCGADSSDNVNKNHNLPHRIFYPIEIIKPKWVSVDEMNLPKRLVKITNI